MTGNDIRTDLREVVW